MAVRYPVDYRGLSEEDHLILKVLRLYYEHDLTQAEVASRLGFSRPKVSKLIADSEDRDTTELSAGRAGAALLARLCTANTILGLSWGVSVRALADATPHRAFGCKRVVPLVGGMGKAQAQLHSNQVCADLAEKLDAECLHLAAPAIARSSGSRAELAALPGIEDTLAEGAACDVAVVGIGGILPSSTMVEAGYFTLDEFLGLRERGIVGDVCCHFLDAAGRTRYPELSERIVGLTPEELRAIDKTIGIATGAEKAPGVAAVARGGFIKALVCDRELARALLETEATKESPLAG